MATWQKNAMNSELPGIFRAVPDRKDGFAIDKQEITLKLYSPLTGDFFPQEVYDDTDWMDRVGPDDISGYELADYEEAIQSALQDSFGGTDGDLMPYFSEKRNPGVKAKVRAAVPSVELRNGELMGCTTVRLREPLDEVEMRSFQEYLLGQFSDGWGEGFEQHEIQTADGALYVHFWNEESFSFEVVPVQTAELSKETPVPKRPQMKLAGMDGNIFSILGKASQLLKRNGQPEQAKEMMDRVCQSGDYHKALSIISEYVETELSAGSSAKTKKRGDAR